MKSSGKKKICDAIKVWLLKRWGLGFFWKWGNMYFLFFQIYFTILLRLQILRSSSHIYKGIGAIHIAVPFSYLKKREKTISFSFLNVGRLLFIITTKWLEEWVLACHCILMKVFNSSARVLFPAFNPLLLFGLSECSFLQQYHLFSCKGSYFTEMRIAEYLEITQLQFLICKSFHEVLMQGLRDQHQG